MAAAVNSSTSHSDVDALKEECGQSVTSTMKGAPRKNQICYFFNSKKGCFKGDACNFLHTKRGKSNHGSQEKSAQDEIDSQQPQAGEILENLMSSNITKHKLEEAAEATRNTEDLKENVVPASDEQADTSTCIPDNPDDSSKESKGGNNKKVCYSFSRTKKCRFGDECKFAHVYKQKEKLTKTVKGAPYDPPVQSEAVGDIDKPFTAMGSKQQIKSQSKKTWRKKLCRYYDWGCCAKGDQCTFWHPADPQNLFADFENKLQPASDHSDDKHDMENTSNAQSSNTAKTSTVANQPNIMQRYILSQLGENDVEKLRKTELEQVKKRYPKAEEMQEGMSDVFEFMYKMTDPDWPFDVSRMLLQVVFSKDYPMEALQVRVLDNEDIPPAVKRLIERRSSEWVDTRFNALMNDDKIELMFRPFLKWLDRQLEEIFTEGLRQMKRELVAKAAGLEFVTAEELQEQYQNKDTSSDEEEEEEYDTDDDNEEYETVSEEDEETRPEIDPVRRGTEVKLRELQLKENIATLTATKLNLIIQCDRCKFQTELATPAERLNSILCTRCNTEQFVTFRPAMVHQASSTLGYLDLGDCAAFDVILMDCKFNIGCLGCNKEGQMDGLVPGQAKDMWCRHCHGKQTISTEGIRFQLLQPAAELDANKAHVVGVKKQRKIQKDPSIQLGRPLPDNGICKHYKKSFRWFRFPCCGKTYPCDICHDMNEMDHEMKYANRVVCGYCCKEQPYSADHPCTGCGLSMTKKASTHWEGGKGCRDKTKMARTESRKYASANKTVSRKAMEKLQKGKKKRTNSK